MIYADEHVNEIDVIDEAQNPMDGAGTKNALTDADNKMEKARKQTQLLEFTVEAGRPDSITREKLEVIHRHNISRISINPQTMKEETLRLIGRQHTVQQTIDSFKLAREVGFDNINMDLIVGLPEESIADVRETMRQLEELDPDNITVHSLAIMEEKQTIMALGAGATTKVVFEDGKRIERVGNVKDIINYLDRVDEMVERKRELLKNCGQL